MFFQLLMCFFIFSGCTASKGAKKEKIYRKKQDIALSRTPYIKKKERPAYSWQSSLKER